MKRISYWLMAILLSSVLQATYGSENLQLYQGDITVNNTTEEARNLAIKQAFQQVLIKVSGDSGVVNAKALQNAITAANDYVDQFNYYGNTEESADGMSTHGVNMRVQFDPATINQLLQKSKEPIWGMQRPLTLVWLAIETPDGKQLVGTGNNDKVASIVESTAKLRGIPLLFPALDLEDLNTIAVGDIWVPNVLMIQQASKRYGVDTILVGKVTINSKGVWNVNWTSVIDNKTENWQENNADLKVALQSSMNKLADTLSKKFVTNNKQGLVWVTVNVTGINKFDDLAKVKAYLRHLSQVKELQTTSINTKNVVFQLQIAGGEQALTDALSIDQKLTPVKHEQDTKVANDNVKEFQWVM